MPKYFSAKNIKKSSSRTKNIIFTIRIIMLSACFLNIFFPKVNPLFKNGQNKCPKTKTQNTFGKKEFTFFFKLYIKYIYFRLKEPTTQIHYGYLTKFGDWNTS